jgi:hypothetical protein
VPEGQKEKIMRKKRYVFHGLVWSFYICLSGTLMSAYAVERGTTNTGINYVSGGVGQTELVQLNEEKMRYSFWLTTATKRSGSYLAAVRVRILNASTHQPVLEHTMEGPWFFAALPTGSYDVEASYAEASDRPVQVQKKSTTIHPGDHHQMVLYFDTPDTVNKEDAEPAFKTNPYTGK